MSRRLTVDAAPFISHVFRCFFGYRPEPCKPLFRELCRPRNCPASSVQRRSARHISGRTSGSGARTVARAASAGDGDADRYRRARCRAGIRRIAARTTDRSHWRDGKAVAPAPRRVRGDRARRMGGVHRCLAHPRTARLDRSRRYGILDRATAGSSESRMVRGRPGAQRGVFARGSRFRTADLACGRRATHRTRARIQRGVRDGRFRERDAIGRCRAIACAPTTTMSANHGRERIKSSSTRCGGQLCKQSGASPVYAFRGSRSARCGVSIGKWEARARKPRSYS